MSRMSGSALPRIEVCPPSAALPQVGSTSEAADAGSALHDHIRHRAELGLDDAVARLEETMARWGLSETEAAFLRSRLMKFEWCPPHGSICEVRLALMPDWSVTRVPAEQRFVEGTLFTGQFDVVWAEPEPLIVNEDGSVLCPERSTLWVLDLKGGQDRYVTTIERNLQVHTYALLAARWTRAKRVVPAVCFPGPGHGDWDVPGSVWGARQLEEVEGRLRRMLGAVELAESSIAAGEPLDLTEGRHCDYCPALTRCPAKIALFRSIFNEGPPDLATVPLNDTESSRLVSLVAVLDTVQRRARRVLEAQVQETGRPIPLGDGIVWGPQTTERTTILAGQARSVLAEALGEFAAIAMNVDVSGASIERAVKAKLEAAGKARGVSPEVRRIYAKLGEVGALVQKPRTEWGAHRPKLAQTIPRDVEDLDEAVG